MLGVGLLKELKTSRKFVMGSLYTIKMSSTYRKYPTMWFCTRMSKFIDDVCYAVALLHCGVSLSNPNWWSGIKSCGFKPLLIFFNISFTSTFEIVGSMKRPLDFSQVWVSLLFVQSLMTYASIRVVVWRW